MGKIVVDGARCQCMFGTAPSTLKVSAGGKLKVSGKPCATIKDMVKGASIGSFGMCMSLANPQVAAATAAALGVLTPQPCNFVPAGPWTPSNPKCLAQGVPVLTEEAKLMCAFGAGMISVSMAGQIKVSSK